MRPWWLAIALTCCCLLPVGACVETASLGPYTRWFNQQMNGRATAAGLVGQPEAKVEVVLGRPSNDYTYPASYILNGDGGRSPVGAAVHTFDYYPYPLLSFSKFQVHCHDGVVTSLELFDD